MANKQPDRGEQREEFIREGMEMNASGVAIMETSWVRMQQKVFTKWCNSQLKRGNQPQMNDLVEDMDTGIPLINLMLALYPGTPEPRYNKNPRMRIHKVDNTANAIAMVESTGIRLVGTKNTHLVDKDQKMILGMIWTIISKYQVAGISEEDLNAKDALLLWCKKKTRGYNGVNVVNFTNSWCDGLALCALIHKHRPDLIDFNSLTAEDRVGNLNLAFKVAEEHLDIDPLLDAEDVAQEGAADERSMITYLSAFYHAFAGMGQLDDATRRISNAIDLDRRNAELRQQYENGAAALAAWIQEKTEFHQDRENLPDNEDEIKGLLRSYGQYKAGPKVEKTLEKANLEAIFNQLQTSLSMNNRPAYVPESGLAPADIQNSWNGLGTEEIEYVSALRKMLNRLQQSDILLKRWRTKSKKFLLRADLLQEEGALVLDEAIATEKVSVIDECGRTFATLRQEEQDIASSFPELEALVGQIHELGLEETRYTENTLESVSASWAATQEAVNQLELQLAEESKNEKARDAVRQQFAKLADPAYKWVRQKADEIVAPGSGNLEKEISAATAHQAALAKFDMKSLEAAHNKQSEMGIYNNEYTTHTWEEIAALFDGLGPALKDKLRLLNNQKAAQSGQQVSEEQMAEFSSSFHHFDRNRTGSLTPLEFKSCLQALGHPLSDSEVATIFKNHTNGASSMTFQQFLPYILSIVQDSDSAPQIIESFRAIAGGADTVTEAQLRQTLPADHVDYIVQNFPAAADGSIDYQAGTNAIYGK